MTKNVYRFQAHILLKLVQQGNHNYGFHSSDNYLI